MDADYPLSKAAALADTLIDPEVCRRIPPQALSIGAAGVALLHIERSAHGLADPATHHAWLKAAAADGLCIGSQASPVYGAPALAFALDGLARESTYRRARATAHAGVRMVIRRRLDAARTRITRGTRPRLGEFDAINGLAGFGAHLLRADPSDNLLPPLLRYLVDLTHPSADGLPGWWSDQKLRRPGGNGPGGHSNHGLAHGITGPLAVLALAARRGITVPGQVEAMERICHWLDTWQQGSSSGGPWWPETLTLQDLSSGAAQQSQPGRPSWCYGTPGIARAQQLAGLALGDASRQRLAVDAMTSCLADPRQLGRVTDPGLCHGVAGLAQIAWRMAADDASCGLRAQLPRLGQMLADAGLQGAPGLLEGTAGLALAHTTRETCGVRTAWDAFLLIA